MHPFKFITFTFTFTFTASLFLFLSLSPHHAFAAALYHPPTNTSLSSSTLISRGEDYSCSGNGKCSNGPMAELIKLAKSNLNGCGAGPGERLFCTGNVCVFTEDASEPIPVVMARWLLSDLRDFGCAGCGHMNLPFPNATGGLAIIKVDFVEDTKGCNGVCKTNC